MSTDTHKEERLRLLEAALDSAIERARAAKVAAKQAKEESKLAKKEKKRARKALIDAQEEYGLTPAIEADSDKGDIKLVGERIAESPERRRRVRVKKKTPRAKDRAAVVKDRSSQQTDAATDEDDASVAVVK